MGGEFPAEWTLFDPQLASVLAYEAMYCSDPELKEAYRKLATQYLNRSLSNITGPEEYMTQQNKEGLYEITKAPELKIPECYYYYSYINKEGEKVVRVVSSAHSPLNWSVAETHKAIAFHLALAKQEQFALAS